jgi:hypothetical protein
MNIKLKQPACCLIFILTLGFHQTGLVLTSHDPPALNGFYIKVYPHPVSSDLVPESSMEIPVTLNFRMVNLTGKILLNSHLSE